jgi:NADPH:quinone reductase-like Zn-dependent oxidoreductase
MLETMKAAVCTKYGPPEVLKVREVPKPVVNDNEILVKVMATAVNSGDVRVRGLAATGMMKLLMRLAVGFSRPRKPVLGTVYAGVVESLGVSVSGYRVGDKVFGMTGFNFGTHAGYVKVKGCSVIAPMPEHASFEEAASLVFGGQTAIYFLLKAQIKKRSPASILVIGATGSVGIAAIQIAACYGAEVTAVCSTAGKPLMERMGISSVIFYDQQDFTIQQHTYDIIFDAVGKTTRKQCAHLLKAGGVYKTVGGVEYASENLEQLRMIKALWEIGAYKAFIDRTYTLDQIVEAHRYVDTGRKKGNVVLKISQY